MQVSSSESVSKPAASEVASKATEESLRAALGTHRELVSRLHSELSSGQRFAWCFTGPCCVFVQAVQYTTCFKSLCSGPWECGICQRRFHIISLSACTSTARLELGCISPMVHACMTSRQVICFLSAKLQVPATGGQKQLIQAQPNLCHSAITILPAEEC